MVSRMTDTYRTDKLVTDVFNHFCDQSQKQREVQRMEEESW